MESYGRVVICLTVEWKVYKAEELLWAGGLQNCQLSSFSSLYLILMAKTLN